MEEEKKEVDLLEYWRIIKRRKWVVISFAALLVILVGLFTFTAVPLYRAKASVLMEEPGSNMLSIQEFLNYGYYPRYDLMDRYFNTQLKILTSRSLAERVARKMDLRTRPELQKSKKAKKSLNESVKSFLSFRWVFPRKSSSAKEPKPNYQPDPYFSLSFVVLGGLSVTPVKDTRLVELSYTSPYPLLAADIVNSLAEEFINYSVEMRYEATQQASEFLSEQIEELKRELATKERSLQRYGEEKKLFFLNEKESTVVAKFADLNEAFTQAQIDRIKKEVAYRELSGLDVDALPPYVNNSLIQGMKAEYTNMKNEYKEKGKVFKPEYPEMVKLWARIESMRKELRQEIQKEVSIALAEYRSALKKEKSLESLLDEQREDVIKMNSNAILYNSIQIEVENKRKLLNTLVAKQNETLVSARLGGLKTSNIRIVDKALVPKGPISPNKKRNLMLALLLGLFGGVGICFLLEYLDNSVKGPEDVERLAGLPSLGVIPYLPPEGMRKKGRYNYYSSYKYSYSYGGGNPGKAEDLPEIKEIELVNHLYPKFSISEDYRTVRTSILLSHAENPPKTITFSSALPREGKTATVANMAVAFSQLEQRVLVLDADLRKPRLHRIFKVRNHVGLSGYLTGKVSFEDAIQKTAVENIWLLPSGPHPPNPSELLNSKRMKELLEEVKASFDVILVDTPPVLVVVDSAIVSSLSDSTVFIVRAEKTTRKPFLQAIEELRLGKSRIIGVIFNEVKVRKEGYYSHYYKYYRYHYYRDGKE